MAISQKSGAVLASSAETSVRQPKRRIPGRVLHEEDYVSIMSQIVERDYFPDLPKLRLCQEVYLAEAEGDIEKADQIRYKVQKMITPISVHQKNIKKNEDSIVSKKDIVVDEDRLVNLTDGREVYVSSDIKLDEFQRLYTSEDNAAFDEIVQRERDAYLKQQWWIEQASVDHEKSQKLVLEALNNSSSTKPGLLFTKNVARPALHWIPDGEEEQPSAKNAAYKDVSCSSTRLSQNVLPDLLVRQMKKQNLLGEMVVRDKRCNEVVTRPDWNRAGTAQIPDMVVDGYTFVSTPIIQPVSPMMTYGQVVGTPVIINEQQNSFRIPSQPIKETVAHKLADASAKKRRKDAHLSLTPMVEGKRGTRRTPGANTLMDQARKLAARTNSESRSIYDLSSRRRLTSSAISSQRSTPLRVHQKTPVGGESKISLTGLLS
eukprot:GHVL01005953.1.p1 GENE.GHVL01005953.1~~GHVL01005953.1.p1  ORF type:complete len:431 (+),score=86.96 GHVL01005953.1:165-1457(+)